MGAIADVVAAVAAVSVSGVTRSFTYPPVSLSTANLPAKWVMPPGSAYEAITTCSADDDVVTVELVIAIEPFPQATQSVNYAALLAMADNLNTALKTARDSIGAMVTWSIAAQTDDPVVVAGVAYWGLTATITARYF